MKLQPFQESEEKKKVYIFNPLDKDFSVTYDINGNKIPQTYTVHAGEIESFSSEVAEHIKKHLANEVVYSRGIRTNYEDDLKIAEKDITIDFSSL